MKVVKRHFLLLEVLIAFLIVALVAIPLISPHVAIYKDQLKFLHLIELDHAVNEVYASFIEKLYRQEIPWEALENQTKFPIDKEFLISAQGQPLPYKGHYHVKKIKTKPKKDSPPPFTVNLLEVEFILKPTGKNNKEVKYTYQVFLPRQLQDPGTNQQGKQKKP